MNKINLIVYDFDGVMTDNCALVDEKGNELVKVNRSDGLAISKIKEKGIKQIILSTEKNKVVSKRAEKLGIDCYQDNSNKKEFLVNYRKKQEISLGEVIFIGNDINDLEAMKLTGRSYCPSDANQKIKKIASETLKTKGGEGVIREFYDFILQK